jgi:hypothetical protein
MGMVRSIVDPGRPRAAAAAGVHRRVDVAGGGAGWKAGRRWDTGGAFCRSVLSFWRVAAVLKQR